MARRGFGNICRKAIEADIHVRSPVPNFFTIIIERKLAWPAIVSLPGRVGALEQKIRASVIAHDEDHVALPAFHFSSEFAEINSAQPVLGDFERGARLPPTFAQTVLCLRRVRLHPAFERSKAQDVSAARAAIKPHAIQVDSERRGGTCADMKANPFTGTEARS